MEANRNATRRREVEVTRAELPLHCPLPSQALWNSHPRVYLQIENTGAAQCPYCGTRYVLKGGPARASH